MIPRREDLIEFVRQLNETETENWSYELTDDHKIAIYDENSELCGFYSL